MPNICDVNDVRNLADISRDDVNDSTLGEILDVAIALFNDEVNSTIRREQIEFIDSWHENDINGSNTTYYLLYPQLGFYVGDSDDSGSITTDDVTVKEWLNDNTITTKTVTSIDGETGEIALSSAPATSSILKATYEYTPVDVSTPDKIAKSAVANLAAALSMTKLEGRHFKKISLRVLDMTTQPSGFKEHYRQYQHFLNKIKRRMFRLSRHSASSRPDLIKQSGVLK